MRHLLGMKIKITGLYLGRSLRTPETKYRTGAKC